MSVPPNLLHYLPYPGTPWEMSQPLKERVQNTDAQDSLFYKKVQLLPTDPEMEFVLQLFHSQKPTAYGIKRVYYVYRKSISDAFNARLSMADEAAQAYPPRWPREAPDDARVQIMQRWNQLKRFGLQSQLGRTHVLPLWHGSKGNNLDKICQLGFKLRNGEEYIRDSGFFGKGHYFATTAKYSVDAYNKDGNVLISWVFVTGEPYPIKSEDFRIGTPPNCQYPFLGKMGKDDHDTHYIPVVSAKPNEPFHSFYEPAQRGQDPMGDEIVVFNDSQILPAYWVELEPDLPFSPTLPLSVENLLHFVVNILRHENPKTDTASKEVLNQKIKELLKELTLVNGSHHSEEDCAALLHRYTALSYFFKPHLASKGKGYFSSPYIKRCQQVLTSWRGTFASEQFLTAFPNILEKLLSWDGWEKGRELLLLLLRESPEVSPFSPLALFEEFLKKKPTISLVEFAIQTAASSESPEAVEQYFSLIDEAANHLVGEHASDEEHEKLFQILSSGAILEPLRARYLKKMPPSALFDKLASIPNRSGYRQKMRVEQEALIQQLVLITQKDPTPVRVTASFFKERRYLTKEHIKTLLGPEGHVKRECPSSGHAVCRLRGEGFDVYLKEKPSQPMQEFSIYSLTNRIAGKGVPPSNLVRFDVELPGMPAMSYPVLFSKTVPGKNLKDVLSSNPSPDLDRGHLTYMLLLALVTRPGDARASNYIVTPQGEPYCVDNDGSFVEPIVREWFRLNNTVYFKSILHCLNRSPLDPKVLQEFINLSADLIFEDWINELLEREKEYSVLFNPEETERLYKEDVALRFTPKLILSAGTITTVYMQLLFLQKALKETLPKSGLDLLKYLITLKENDRGINNLGPLLHRFYNEAYIAHSTPLDRLQVAIGVKNDLSLTSEKALIAGVGTVPTSEKIKSRGPYSLENLQKEFRRFAIQNQEGAFAVEANGKLSLHRDFSSITLDGKPDLERQRLMLRGLLEWLALDDKKPHSLTLTSCSALTTESLLSFLHNDLTYLDLRGSAIRALPPKIEECPLKELYLTACPELYSLSIPGYLSNSPLNLPHLEKLEMARCDSLTEVRLKAPKLQEWVATNNPNLSQVTLIAHLTTIVQIQDSPKVDLNESGKALLSPLFDRNFPDYFYGAIGEYIFHLMKNGESVSKGQRLGEVLVELTEEKLSVDIRPFLFESGYDLRKLNWRSSNLTEELKVISVFLSQTPIIHLDLSDNKLGEAEVQALVRFLRNAPITQLNLADCEIGFVGLAALSSELKNTQVTQLDLGKNKLGDAEAQILADILPQTKITELNIENNQIREAGLRVFAEALPQTNIIRLNIAANRIGNDGAQVLSEVLPRTKIKRLTLVSNRIEEAGTLSLANVLTQTQIIELDLRRNVIGEVAVQALLNAMPQGATLLFDKS